MTFLLSRVSLAATRPSAGNLHHNVSHPINVNDPGHDDGKGQWSSPRVMSSSPGNPSVPLQAKPLLPSTNAHAHTSHGGHGSESRPILSPRSGLALGSYDAHAIFLFSHH